MKYIIYSLSLFVFTLGFGRDSNRSDIKLTNNNRGLEHKSISENFMDENNDLERKRSIKRRRKMRKPRRGLR